MSQCKLSFREFLIDIKATIGSPACRFSVIKERGALWGSLLLLTVPGYFGFGFMAGIYFNREPFPGYSFILPAVLTSVFCLLKVYLIHFWARVFEGRGHYSRASGTFRNMLAVFGYTSVPSILAVVLSFAVFLLIPEQVGMVMRQFTTFAVCILVALGIALFIWNLILMVLAMRVVYPLRDLKIVVSWLLGTVLLILPWLAISKIEQSAKVDLSYVQPLMTDRLLRFFAVDPTTHFSPETEINLPVDLLSYRFRSPDRFELVAFQALVGSSSMFNLGKLALGRIVAKPGDNVGLIHGRLLLNDQLWDEPYIPPEFRSDVSLPATHLGSSEYFILPEDRRLIESLRNDLVVSRDRIRGRAIIEKWPFGWWYHRSTAFLAPAPATPPL